MTGLWSMLVPAQVLPLETLPGWPTVEDPSALQVLGLLVGAPLVVIAITYGIAKLGDLRKASRGDAAEVTDPVWVGGPSRPEIEGPEHDKAVEEAKAAAGGGSSSDVGGASARW